MTTTILDKGGEAEELLRDYFLGLGYFVVRAVKFTYQDNDITDIDLWLYHRHSPIARERINVDIKNKKTPQAIERIFWARGVQLTLGLDRCIVATTDSRKAVVEFGRKYDVLVLDGTFLAILKSKKTIARIPEEALLAMLNLDGLGKLAGDWVRQYESAKSRLLSHLDFDGCNRWLEDFAFFANKSLEMRKSSAVAIRLAYIMASYFLIGLDFSLAQLTFSTKEEKRAAIEEGLRYGKEGRSRVATMLELVSQIAATYAPVSSNAEEEIKQKASESASSFPVEILGEYFSKTATTSQIFQTALAFQEKAYNPLIVWPENLPIETKSVFAILADFIGLDRKKIFSLGSNAE